MSVRTVDWCWTAMKTQPGTPYGPGRPFGDSRGCLRESTEKPRLVGMGSMAQIGRAEGVKLATHDDKAASAAERQRQRQRQRQRNLARVLADGIDDGLADAGWQLLETARRILLLAHYHPDPDALGSALGLAYVLAPLGKVCVVACADPVPERFAF